MYKNLSSIILSRLTPYAEEDIGDHQCGFRSSKSTTDIHTFCFRKILEKKWECKEAIRQQFIQFKKDYESVTSYKVYKILFECGNPMKRVGLIKMCLNKTYKNVRVGKHLSDMFPVKNGLKNKMLNRHCF